MSTSINADDKASRSDNFSRENSRTSSMNSSGSQIGSISRADLFEAKKIVDQQMPMLNNNLIDLCPKVYKLKKFCGCKKKKSDQPNQ